MNVFQNSFFGRLANWLIAFVSAFLLLFNVTDVEKQKTDTIDLSQYNLVFDENFDGTEINSTYWGPHCSYGLRKGGYWSKDQSFLRDGNLVIRTEYKQDGEFGPGWYTGNISTQRKYLHGFGYYECRCILPKGKGLWSAFWLMNDNVNKVTQDASKGAEIDIFESPYYFFGGEYSWKVTSNIHYSGYELDTKYQNVVISALDNNPYENYNTYGLDWTADEYIFYVNGKEVARSTFGGVSQEKEYMILSCEVDGSNGKPNYGWSDRIDNYDKDTFFAEFIVDYVRIYEKK